MTYSIEDMVIDRTDADVDTAKKLRKDVVQEGKALTNEQIEQIEKGSCTVNVLNRIEGKQKELNDLLLSYAYMANLKNKTDWQYNDTFTYQDHQRILENLDKLINAFFRYPTTPNVPKYLFSWQNANDVEKILVDIEMMIGDMEERFRECGTFECGEV